MIEDTNSLCFESQIKGKVALLFVVDCHVTETPVDDIVS